MDEGFEVLRPGGSELEEGSGPWRLRIRRGFEVLSPGGSELEEGSRF